MTLALVMFTDAAGVDMGVLRKTSGLPVRLLLIGLPLTILLGFGVAMVLIDTLSLFAMALLATMLALLDAMAEVDRAITKINWEQLAVARF